MTLEAFRDSNTELPIPIFLENLTSQNEEDLQSILSMAQFNTNSITLGNSSSSRSAIADVYLQSHGNTTVGPYINLPSYQPSLSSHNPANNFYDGDVFSHLRQLGERDSKKQHLGSTSLYKKKVETNGIDVNQEAIQEFLLKELRGYNYSPQFKEMIERYKQQMQIQQSLLQPASDLRGFHLQIPKQQSGSGSQEQVNQHEIFAPLLDGGLCSRRFKQYLYHLRNNKHENDISYWRRFVSEYYAPGSKKKWCFSKYENIELHTVGVFCPKSMETWCCDLCGVESGKGKGLEATSEVFPRLFKIKYESGMIDEILYLDSPRACKVSRGVVLEYRKVIQESVYETFRVVHRGKLRIVFGHDLKITSWEFCIESHDEYLLRTLFSPQVNLLDKAVEKYHYIQNLPTSRAQDLRKVCDMFVSAGNQILENMDLPLVNDLGYPKRFIRCLQIGEVVDTMRDLMTFSHNAKVGPIEGLNSLAQGIKTSNKRKQEMEQSIIAQNRAILNDHMIRANGLGLAMGSSFNSYLYNEPVPLLSEKTRDQALFDKLIREMVGSSSRGKSVQETYDEVVQRSNRAFGMSNESTAVILSHVNGQKLTTKPEPYSPEKMPEGLSRIENFIGSFSGKTTY